MILRAFKRIQKFKRKGKNRKLTLLMKLLHRLELQEIDKTEKE